MDELIGEFLEETNESLEELDLDLVNLEQSPNDTDLLSKIFRLVHTIKGTCGFIGLPRLEKIAHHAENVLGRFRDGALDVTPEYVTLIFESIDAIKFIVGTIGETGSEPDGDDSEIIKKLDAVYEGINTNTEEKIPAPKIEEPEEKPEEELPVGMVSEAELEAAFAAAPGPENITKEEKKKKETEDDTTKTKKTVPTTTAKTLRVSVDVLEDLMTMVGEMVLTRNQLLQLLRTQTESEFTVPLQHLNHVVSELQEGVMKTRMQPIGNAWTKLPRIIRDISLELGKKINLEMIGQDTELDRQVLELIKDPLTHMVRNSGDHGIEVPEERITAGKPETGTISLKAYHEGGHIIIKISDDGKGLPLDKIKAKILENGLATLEELNAMSDQQIHQYIFNAGLSTAEKVTAVSGRGVGMDVVRTNVEKIGGSISLTSKEGKGSTFSIKIPLTLAIVSALIVESSGERFAIPQISVHELVMISSNSENRIEMIKNTPVFRLRDRLLPLVSLSELLKLTNNKNHNGTENIDNTEEITKQKKTETETLEIESRYIVVTQVGTYSFGIIVDRVFDTEEIVVKPVASILRNIEIFSGNTILGDGSVIMIIDPNGIAKATGEIETADDKDAFAQDTNAISSIQQKTSLLLFNANNASPKAVPLSLVARLENIDLSNIEHSSGQMMVQYRGQLMPLIPFSSSTKIGKDGVRPILVFTDKGKSMGLVVDEIIDITEEYINVQLESKKEGLVGSAIINEKATDVVDVGYFLSTVDTEWFKSHGNEPFGNTDNTGKTDLNKHRVLLIDDSSFFRNMLAPLLSVAGYEVTSLESPIEALKLCEEGTKFDIIVSDIEMPDMDGFEFAEKIKTGSNWQDIPLVALSSHATPQDISRGLDVGFNKYVAKFDRNILLDTLSQTLAEQTSLQENAAINN